MRRFILKSLICVGLTISITGLAQADSLKNLERERSLTLITLMDANLSPVQRQKHLNAAKPRLLDLERIVLRDKKNIGRNTPTVRKAFQNYDLTFMVHAAAENNLILADNWLNQLGVSTETLMASKVRQRW